MTKNPHVRGTSSGRAVGLKNTCVLRQYGVHRAALYGGAWGNAPQRKPHLAAPLLLRSFLVLALWLGLHGLTHAAGSDGGAISDPRGQGDPPHRYDPALSAMPIHFSIHGYYRMRWTLLSGLDLGRGPTPSSGTTIFPKPTDGSLINTADMRFRTDLSLEIGSTVRVFARVDGLDNVVLGSTPEGLPRNNRVPQIVATTGQRAPSAGQNNALDSINLRWAYGEVLLPFGYLAVGRMGALTPWGLGLLVNPGNAIDDDQGDVADRIAMGFALFGHLLLVAYEWSASGPTLTIPSNASVDQDPRDNVQSIGIAIANYDPPDALRRKLNAGQTVINYGVIFSYRWQDRDIPALYAPDGWSEDQRIQRGDQVLRKAWSVVVDAWFLLRTPWFRLEMEGLYAQAEIGNGSLVPGVALTLPITSQQLGGVVQFAFSPPQSIWGIGAEIGYASGDNAPGFGVTAPLNQIRTQRGDLDGPQINYPNDTTSNNLRFHPNYRIDLIFWRRILGQVTDAFYTKLGGHLDITPRLRFWASVLYSRAIEANSTPGGVHDLGVEINTGLRYDYDHGFQIRTTFGAFFPLAGLRNNELNLAPQPALALHTVLAYVF
ncbi:TIGR04551 family protein [Myxococcota bacterium]|nr:TIGR04551 family protein [Myxococcota bacterium]